MIHFGQEVENGAWNNTLFVLTFVMLSQNSNLITGKYIRHDYGTLGNSLHYGQATPPEYDVTQVRVPVMTFWGDNDWLADPLVRIRNPSVVAYSVSYA